MTRLHRRAFLAAGGTLASVLAAGKPRADELGDLARKLTPVEPPEIPPQGTFEDAEGRFHALGDFLGHGMVVNFWATWCGPCVRELPALSALSLALAPDNIAVLPLSTDRGGASFVGPWLKDRGITALPVLIDPKGAMARAWGVRGLPTSFIIDRKGRSRARLEGAADWSTPAAAALIRALVAA